MDLFKKYDDSGSFGVINISAIRGGNPREYLLVLFRAGKRVSLKNSRFASVQKAITYATKHGFHPHMWY